MMVNAWGAMPDKDHEYLLEVLDEAQQLARQRNFLVHITLGVTRTSNGFIAEVHPRGKKDGAGFKYHLEVEGVRFLINSKNNPTRTNNILVQAMGGAMMRAGWSATQFWGWAEGILTQMGFRIDRHSIARADFFSDLVGVPSWKLARLAEKGQFVRRAKEIASYSVCSEHSMIETIEASFAKSKQAVIAAVEQFYDHGLEAMKVACKAARRAGEMDQAVYGVGKKGRGVQFGRGDIVCRIYDKQFQLDRFHPERIPVMCEAWECDKETPVTRVEYQIRGSALRRWSIKTVEDLDECRTKLIEYLTQDWLCACSKYDKRNKDRREVHPLWRRTQAVFRNVFSDGHRNLEKPVVVPDEETTRRMMKTAIGMLRTASGRAFGPIDTVGDYRTAVHQLVEEGVTLCDGWDQEYSGHLHKLAEYYNKVGGDVEPSYPLEQWAGRPELIDVMSAAGVPRE